MKAVAVCLTYGRASVCELLACWERQTRPVPLFLWVDDAPFLEVEAHGVTYQHGPRFDDPLSVSSVRAAATRAAIGLYELGPDDVLIVLDDDDFYAADHADIALAPFSDPAVEWVAGLAMGLQLEPGAEPQYVSGESGVGQHGTWAYRRSIYERAGGYLASEGHCDPGLAMRMGWSRCRPHFLVTHVRRHHPTQISGPVIRYRRESIRAAREPMTSCAHPVWTAECERLQRWTELQNARAISPGAYRPPPSSGTA